MFEKLLQKLKFGSGKANKSDNVNAFKESEKKQNTGTKIDVKDESAKTEQKQQFFIFLNPKTIVAKWLFQIPALLTPAIGCDYAARPEKSSKSNQQSDSSTNSESSLSVTTPKCVKIMLLRL